MKILYFAWLREKVGVSSEDLAVPDAVATVRELMLWLQARGAGHAAAFANGKLVRCAVDQEFVGMDAPIAGAREIAFFPPVTGG
jgi:molybdopterin synthase sulfur carrier subunit